MIVPQDVYVDKTQTEWSAPVSCLDWCECYCTTGVKVGNWESQRSKGTICERLSFFLPIEKHP